MILDQFRLFVLAVQFYTRVPVVGSVSAWANYQPDRLAKATRYFPLVGALVGLLVAMTYVFMANLLPHSVAVLIAVICGVLVTGAFHEDGWADFCDGFGGAVSRERTLEIMSDSRIGAYGAIGLLLLFALKLETLASIDPSWVAIGLVCAHAFSRACAVMVMMMLPYARLDDETKAKPIAQGVSRHDCLIAIAIGLAPTVAATLWFEQYEAFLLAALPALTATVWLSRKFFRRLGGYTGDCLGATQQICETFFYVGLACWLTLYQNSVAS